LAFIGCCFDTSTVLICAEILGGGSRKPFSAPTATTRVRSLYRRPGHSQDAGRFDLRLAGGEHPASFGKP
jgi:hypothetical protein